MVRIGIAGAGFMGWIHYSAIRRLPNVTLAAVATRDSKKRAGDWTSIRGNFGPPGEQLDFSDVAVYSSVEELASDPTIDLIDLCLPSDLHAASAEIVLGHGKHCFVEKPIALTLQDADQMVASAKRAGKQLMVGHVLPYFPDFGYAWEAVQSGRYGRLIAAHFRRHISPPDWSDAFADVGRTGGPAIDLHIHDTHFIRVSVGTPSRVTSTGVQAKNGRIDYISTQYEFPGGPNVSATSGAISAAGRPFTHGFELYFENATLFYEAGGPLVVYDRTGRSEPDLGDADPISAFAKELQAAVTSLKEGQPAAPLDGALARDALAICLAELESVATGRPMDLN